MSKSVCVLDDDRQIVTLATAVLEEKGHTVDGFIDVDAAKAFLMSQKCDIVVVDLVMPKTSGLDFTAWLREFSPFSRVINITGIAPVKTILGCWRRGADSCVLKGKGFPRLLSESVDASIQILDLWQTTIETVRDTERAVAARADADAEPGSKSDPDS